MTAPVSARYDAPSGPTWADPWPMYAALRDRDPVHHVTATAGDHWVLTRYADVFAAARDTTTFSSRQGLTTTDGELEALGLAERLQYQRDPAAAERDQLLDGLAGLRAGRVRRGLDVGQQALAAEPREETQIDTPTADAQDQDREAPSGAPAARCGGVGFGGDGRPQSQGPAGNYATGSRSCRCPGTWCA